MTITVTKRSLPKDSEDGKVFELFKTDYTFKLKKSGTLPTHPKGNVSLRGFVPDKYTPKEGGTFVMYHHRAADLMNFGDVKLEKCSNVIEDDGYIYFEDMKNNGKYVLVPCRLD